MTKVASQALYKKENRDNGKEEENKINESSEDF